MQKANFFWPHFVQLRYQKIRLWAWRVAGDRIAGIALYLLGHGMHWQERHRWLSEHGPVQTFQRGMAVLAGVNGLAFLFTGRGGQDGPLARLVDRWPGQFLLCPHQWLGLVLVGTAALLLAAIYEWPVQSEWSAENPRLESLTDSRLRRLLAMQLWGHMVSILYWAITGSLLLFACHTSAGGWFSVACCFLHRGLYIRNHEEYQKECGEIRRWRKRTTQQEAAAAQY